MSRTFSLLLFALFFLSVSANAQFRRIITFAGSGGTGGYAGDGLSATGALFHGPEAISLDKAGNTYIVDFYNARVRKIKTTGQIVNFAGTGVIGHAGDGSASTSAQLDPQGVAADWRGNVFISDPIYNIIRKVNTLGIISTYAGNPTAGYAYTGDGGPATAAKLAAPTGMICDKKSSLYFADGANNVIRKIDSFGTITTVAGVGTAGYSGDGLMATDAELDSPYAVAVDKFGDLFIADYKNNVIRMVDAVTGLISTYAGTGTVGYAGDGAPAVAASLNYPTGVAVDTALNIYISDSYNNVIRMVDASGTISTVAGNGSAGFGGDLGDPLGANLFHPYGIAVDTFGSIFIADANNQRIRKVYFTTVGVDDVALNQALIVFPNPVADKITIANLRQAEKACIYDLTGRAVTPMLQAAKDGDQEIAVNTLSKGVYLLQVWDADGNKKGIVKLIK